MGIVHISRSIDFKAAYVWNVSYSVKSWEENAPYMQHLRQIVWDNVFSNLELVKVGGDQQSRSCRK